MKAYLGKVGRKVEPQLDKKPDIILEYNKKKGAVDTRQVMLPVFH